MRMDLAQRTRVLALGGAIASLLALAPTAQAQIVCFSATLDGAQEVPPNASTATGTAFAVMDLAANTFTIDITYTGTTETGSHIHGFAPPGANGGVEHFFASAANTKHEVWNYDPNDAAKILAGLAYVNIHTAAFPGGEIRGQLLPDGSVFSMGATIDGNQEVPPSGSTATGTAHVSIDTVANLLTYNLTYDGLTSSETAAHIHGPAPAGSNGPVLHTLPGGSTKAGVWNYPQANEADILAGNTYINIHSGAFPGGEIRGQILVCGSNPTTYCTASTTSISGCQAQMSSTGMPSESAGSGFVISAGPAPGGNLGILYYGKTGPAAIPFGNNGGFICANPPLLRVFVGSSGGTPGVCDGVYSTDFNDYIANGPDAALVAGAYVNAGMWFRDPPNPIDGYALSNGMMFQILP